MYEKIRLFSGALRFRCFFRTSRLCRRSLQLYVQRAETVWQSKGVRNFADFKVKRVSSFPDLKVKRVKNFPDSCGEWQFVDNFPDFTVQFVDDFPDFTIQYVNSFPGER